MTTTTTTTLVARAGLRLGAKILSAGREDMAVVSEAMLEARDMAVANPLMTMIVESKVKLLGSVQVDGDIVVGSKSARRPLPRGSMTESV
jgi:hypothetical protein